MASTPSPGRHTPSPNEEREEGLRSKRSSIKIECSDGTKVILVLPNRPRSGSHVTISHSHSPSPPPGGPQSGPESGPPPGSSPGNRKKRERPHSMPAPLHVYDSDIHMGHSHRSLPAYISGPCPECGYHRGHSDKCTFGNQPFTPDPISVRAGGEAHDSGIQQQQAQQGHDSRNQGGTQQGDSTRPSVRSESRRPRPGRNESANHAQHVGSGTSRTPSPLHGIRHGPRSPPPPPRQVHTRNPERADDRDSDLSSRARYSIEAVVSPVSPRSHSSRRRHHRRDTFRFELHEISGQEANVHSRSPSYSSSPPHYFAANIRGGYGSGSYQVGGADNRRDSGMPRSGGGAGRRRGRDVLLRGLLRCCVAFSWLFGGDSYTRRTDDYGYDYHVHERSGSRSHRQRTHRH